MSDKTSKIDILGESHIPSDLLTPTLGSNYGMDGYEDMEYGRGVIEGVLDPDLNPAPALPTGLARGASAEMDLAPLFEESVTDLYWLDGAQFEDPGRLPETPQSVPELRMLGAKAPTGFRCLHKTLSGSGMSLPWKKPPLRSRHLHGSSKRLPLMRCVGRSEATLSKP